MRACVPSQRVRVRSFVSDTFVSDTFVSDTFVSAHACVRATSSLDPFDSSSHDVRCAQRATTGMRMLTALGGICRHVRMNNKKIVLAVYARALLQATGRVSIDTTKAPLRT